MSTVLFPTVEMQKIPLTISVDQGYAQFFDVMVPANHGYTAEVRRIEDGSGYFLLFKHNDVICHTVVLRPDRSLGTLRTVVSAPMSWENVSHIYEDGVEYKSGDAVLKKEIQLIVGNLDVSTEIAHTYSVNVV